MDSFSAATRTWFEESFPGPTPVQRRGWEAIARGVHSLLVAPTGSGKTLAAFLWGIDRAAREEQPPAGVRLLYVSPLKALAVDVERNLRAPLVGVTRAAERLGTALRPLRVDVRTGDTTQQQRRRQAREPAEILVTTPESLYLILGSRARGGLATVETVIVDEIHALAPTKRGAHLALSLERLGELCAADPQRIGLSATARPLEEIAAFLGGDRPVEIVDSSELPRLALEVRVPVPDMEHVPPPPDLSGAEERGGPILSRLATFQSQPNTVERGIWPALYPELVEAIRAHRSTILFVNSRGLCERLTQRLNELAGEEVALAHHGSVSHEKRGQIEDRLKRGDVRAIVATSSLELGIDMGAVDLVVLIESPGSVARGLQRVGRAGHHVGDTSTGLLFPKFRGDLLECAVVAERMLEGAIEAVAVPRNPLDVLAQQVVAACCDRPRTVAELEGLVRRAHGFRELPGDALRAVLDMLSGRFPSTELADLRARLAWDRATDTLTPRRGAPMLTRLNAGTIPDRGAFGVYLGEDGPRVGELDEEMVYESREGDTFLLGSSTWRVEQVTRDRVVVSPAPGEPGRLPFWKGEGPGRPIELGRAIGAFVRRIGALERAEALRELRGRLPLSEDAATNLVDYVHEQRAAGVLPTDRCIAVERFRDELGDWRVCVLTPFGARVHAPWALAVEELLARRTGLDVAVLHSDEGLVLRLADGDEPPELDLLLPDPEELEELVTQRVGQSSLFAALFRENAVRSLLIPRRRPDQRHPLWAQRLKARGLLATARTFADFPIVLETYRQALSDVFDLPALRELLGAVRSRRVAVREVETARPSPMARSLVFAYVAAYLYEGDSPGPERRAQALTLDRGLLRELLGTAELRELLDAGAIEEVEDELQARAPGRRARDADELEDLLRRLGDLRADEVAQRCEGDAEAWLARLERERRALSLLVPMPAGRGGAEPRWISADEAGRYRDALGCVPPGGLPSACLAPVEGALEELLRRYARTHGPFRLVDAAERFGLRPAQVEPVLRGLERVGLLLAGEIRPGGSGLEWCDAEVLRRIKRRTLARLRDEIAAVDGAALARFLARWHGLGPAAGPGSSRPTLEEALVQLEGLPLPWSALVRELLPARVPGFAPQDLDALGAGGHFVWIGRGARGARDGLVAIVRRERFDELVDPAPVSEPASPVHAAILEQLGSRGASFLTEVERAVRAALPGTGTRELEQALWDLAWEGRVTNDTFQPLRQLAGPRARGRAAPVGGRWSLVHPPAAAGEAEAGPTRTLLARAETLLARYGVVSREAARAEEVSGGFGGLARVLAAMEESGRIRRGWFVDGLSGTQYALAGALERLREPEGDEPEVLVLEAVDPANPWGALLPWPRAGEGGAEEQPGARRPRRVPGARVVTVGGRAVLYVPPGRRELLTLAPAGADGLCGRDLVRALEHLARSPRGGGRRLLVIERIDGRPAEDGPHRAALEAAGFVRDYRGYVPDPARRGGKEQSRAGG